MSEISFDKAVITQVVKAFATLVRTLVSFTLPSEEGAVLRTRHETGWEGIESQMAYFKSPTLVKPSNVGHKHCMLNET